MAEIVKEDRRIQRTKQLLRDSLMALIVERGAWEPITIQDITDHANVSRTTFYLHFRDKEDLMITTMTDVYNDLVERWQSGKLPPEVVEVMDFQHVAQNADFYRIMLGEKGSPAFIKRVHDYLARVVRDYTLKNLFPSGMTFPFEVDALTNYLAGAEIGVIRWWLESGKNYSPREIATMFETICVSGMAQFFSPNTDLPAVLELIRHRQFPR
jgi:AcrR family transcriptional regulator